MTEQQEQFVASLVVRDIIRRLLDLVTERRHRRGMADNEFRERVQTIEADGVVDVITVARIIARGGPS